MAKKDLTNTNDMDNMDPEDLQNYDENEVKMAFPVF